MTKTDLTPVYSLIDASPKLLLIALSCKILALCP